MITSAWTAVFSSGTLQANRDLAIFYDNLQMLCHDQHQLTTLQAFEKGWQVYKDGAMKTTHAAWPDGSGASGFASQVHLSLVPITCAS